MIHFLFEMPENLVYNIDGYFDHGDYRKFIVDPYCKKFIEDIDNVQIVSEYIALSPIFGSIDTTRLSGGVKELILAYKTDKLVNGNNLGENCIPWFIDISRYKNITVYFDYIPDTLEGLEFEGVWVEKNLPVCNFRQFVDAYCITHGFADMEDYFDE